MFSDTNEKFELEKERLFNLIDAAFSCVQPPKGWEKCFQIEDFEREFGNDFLPEYWRDIFDLEPADTKYVLPFVMKYFVLIKDWSIDDSVNLDLLLMQFDPAVQHEIGFGYFYEAMYSQFSSEQKKAVCEWLNFLQEYANEPLLSSLEGAILYWCSNAN